MSVKPIDEWITKAEDNYRSALDLARRRKEPVPDVVCNQCQQCAEKYLKAWLVWHRLGVPRIHDLIQLEDLIAPADADVRSIHDVLTALNPYGTAVRYPGLGTTVREARNAVEAMKEVRKFARAKLGLKS